MVSNRPAHRTYCIIRGVKMLVLISVLIVTSIALPVVGLPVLGIVLMSVIGRRKGHRVSALTNLQVDECDREDGF